MCNAAAGARASATARHDFIALLRDDFKRVLDEFDRFAELDPDDHRASARIVQRALAEWKVVAAVEAALLYPAVRCALQHTDLIEQSEIEHACIGRLVDALERSDPTRADYRRDFRVLGEHVLLHVQDEEIELFPALRDEQTDWPALYAQAHACRAEMAGDLGIAEVARPGPRQPTPRPAPAPHAAPKRERVRETAEA